MLKEIEKVVKNLLTCDLCGKKIKTAQPQEIIRRENETVPAVRIAVDRIFDGESADWCARCASRIEKLFVRMAEPKQRKTKS